MNALLRPGQAAPSTPLDGMGRFLRACESIPDLIATLENPAYAAALAGMRRVSLAAGTGQADATQFASICALLADRCRNLEQLDIADALLTPGSAEALARLPALTVLALNVHDCNVRSRRPMPDDVLTSLARSPKLHTLMLGNADLPPLGVSPLQNLVTLRSLTLSNCAFYAHDVDSIAGLHRLESFFHRGETDCAAIAQAAAQLLHLETLFLAKFRLNGQAIDIEALQSLSHLRRLHVDEALFTPSSLRSLGKGCTVLQELRVRGPVLSANCVSTLREFKRLRSLYISDPTSDAPCTWQAVMDLRKNHRLEKLQVPGQHFSSRGRHAILAAFGAGALTYGVPSYNYSRTAASDRNWLVKQQIISQDFDYPPLSH